MNASEQSSVSVPASTGEKIDTCAILHPQKTTDAGAPATAVDIEAAAEAVNSTNSSTDGAIAANQKTPVEANANEKTSSSNPESPKNMAGKMPPYFYTQRDFWGGPTLSYPIYVILTFIGGLVGLDHLYLRSPGTAVLKTVVNVLTLGFWYFYDIIQATTESDYVKTSGLSMPFYGPAGIGAGSFLKTGEVSNNSSPLMFLLFAIGVFVLPYGLDYVIAGDMKGAVMKMLSTFWLFGIVYGVINIYKLVMHPERVLCEGTSRYAPFTFVGLNERYTGATFINKDASKCPKYESKGSLLAWLSGVLAHLKNLPVVGTVAGAAAAAVDIATKTVEAVKDGAAEAIGVAANLAQVPGKLDEAAAKAASQPAVSPPLRSTPSLNAPSEEPATPAMAGGGKQSGGGARLYEPESTVISLVFALIFIGAAYMKGKDALAAAIQRTMEKPPAIGTRVERSDLPPAAIPTLGIYSI